MKKTMVIICLGIVCQTGLCVDKVPELPTTVVDCATSSCFASSVDRLCSSINCTSDETLEKKQLPPCIEPIKVLASKIAVACVIRYYQCTAWVGKKYEELKNYFTHLYPYGQINTPAV